MMQTPTDLLELKTLLDEVNVEDRGVRKKSFAVFQLMAQNRGIYLTLSAQILILLNI